jgi:hypothetical protein
VSIFLVLVLSLSSWKCLMSSVDFVMRKRVSRDRFNRTFDSNDYSCRYLRCHSVTPPHNDGSIESSHGSPWVWKILASSCSTCVGRSFVRQLAGLEVPGTLKKRGHPIPNAMTDKMKPTLQCDEFYSFLLVKSPVSIADWESVPTGIVSRRSE